VEQAVALERGVEVERALVGRDLVVPEVQIVGPGAQPVVLVQRSALHVGIDLTRRDLQLKARDTGRPWESGKSFDNSAPISAIHPLKGDIPKSGRIALSVNGTEKQRGDLNEMIWQSDEIVAHLSKLFALVPGDLIYTGTPSGVGKLAPGDQVEGTIENLDTLAISIR